MVPFVIVADLRTGSTLLSTSLNTHPRVRCLGELFHTMSLGIVREEPAEDGDAELL